MATESLPNRENELIAWMIVMITLCTIFVWWRVAVRFRINPKLWLSDYLMIIGWALGIVGNICTIISAVHGYGRMDSDPFLTSARRSIASHFFYNAEVLNLFAMFCVKMSICVFLMVLNFSRSFRYVLWASIFMVVSLNFVLSAVSIFGDCTPIASRWNPKVKGKCWPTNARLGAIYTNAVGNIVIDLVYAASPLVYIRQIRLPTRTRVAIQIVFLLAMCGTAISAYKLVALTPAFSVKSNFLYGTVPGSIMSSAEVAVAMVVACLPPLRKPFERFLKLIIPESLLEKKSQDADFVQPVYFSTNGTKVDSTADGESQKAIIPLSPDEEALKNGGIPKATQVTVDKAELPRAWLDSEAHLYADR